MATRKKKTKNRNSPLKTEIINSFWFQYLVMPSGQLVLIFILLLLVPPVGRMMVQIPALGGLFETACNVIGASCRIARIGEDINPIQQVRFMCIKSADGKFTTIARLENRDVQLIKWTSDYFSQSGYDQETRCVHVSERFQINQDRGTLKFITHDRINGQNVICVAHQKDAACIPDGLLFTLKDNEIPNEVVSRLHDGRKNRKDFQPLEESYKAYIDFNEIIQENPESDLF